MKDAIKVIKEIRDSYIRENCQTFNDGHWGGTPKQQEYVSELDDLIEILKNREALMGTSHEAIAAYRPKGNIFGRPECIFNYCPDPNGCSAACASPKAEA